MQFLKGIYEHEFNPRHHKNSVCIFFSVLFYWSYIIPVEFFIPDMMDPLLLSLILNGNNSSPNQPNVFMVVL